MGIDWIPMGVLGMVGFEEPIWLPDSLFGGPLHEMHSIVSRVSKLFNTAKFLLHLREIMDIVNEPRIARGFDPSYESPAESWKAKLVLVPEPWMFHAARPIDPSTQLVGFLSAPADSGRASALTNPVQDAALLGWLDQLPAGTPVVYVAFGSHLHVPNALLNNLLAGLLLADPSVRVLVGIRDEVEVTLSVDPAHHARLRRESWMPQRKVLSHPAVKLFVSHGGLSSVSESVDASVPLLVVPFFADQLRNAFLLQDAGVGRAIRRADVTPEHVRDTVRSILADYSALQHATNKLKAVSNLAGGRKRAAQLIDHHLQYGSDHLVSVVSSFPIYQRYNLDILAIAFLILYTLYRLFKWMVFRFCCRRIAPKVKAH